MGKKNGVLTDGNNRRNVLESIMHNGMINRSAISKEVGISIPAVMTITEELLANGIIQSVGYASTGVGKHPELLAIRDDYYRYIGVDVGRVHLRAVLVGHSGEVIKSMSCHTEHGEDPDQSLKDIETLIMDLIHESQIDPNTLVGGCIAMPGLIETDTGKVIFSPNFGWKDYPLQEKINECMREKLPIKFIVRNANRAQARYELRPGAVVTKADSALCIGLGYGIGSAIINMGKMYNGASGTSGEIGHITVMPNGPICTCGNSGCLEAVASGYAIELQGKKAAELDPDSILNKIVKGNRELIEAKTVFQAAAMHDEASMRIIDQSAQYIGIGLAAAINLLDPDIICLCGGLMKNGEEFLRRIKSYTKIRQMQFAGRHVRIVGGSHDDYNVARGATMMIQDSGWEFEKLQFLY